MDKHFFDNGWFEAVPKDQCINFKFFNAPYGQATEQVWVFEDHVVHALMKVGNAPDTFSVKAAAGWEVISENYITIQETMTGIITVCSLLMS